MRRILTGSSLALALFALAAVAAANPPSAIYAKYDNARQELNVTVEHVVNNPKSHYIETVEISKNGTEVKKETFTFQTSHRNQTMTPIKLPAAAGDTFKIVATCNIFGKGETTIEVK